MTASIDFYVGFTPDPLIEPLRIRVSESGEDDAFWLEGRAYVEWDEDRPKAFEIETITGYLPDRSPKLMPMGGPIADMALDAINRRYQDDMWTAWRDNRADEEADYRYEVVG